MLILTILVGLTLAVIGFALLMVGLVEVLARVGLVSGGK